MDSALNSALHPDSWRSKTWEGTGEDVPNRLLHDIWDSNKELGRKGSALTPPPLLTDTVYGLFGLCIDLDRQMRPFWDGYRSHFATVGITLCELRSNKWWLPLCTAPSPYPYATRYAQEGGASDSRRLPAKIACGQDVQGRDVIIKLVDKGTMEHQIYEYLSGCEALYNSDTPMCVLPPTAILSSPYKFTFVAMPMWGYKLSIQQFSTIGQVFTFIRCALTGLAFLHEHRIAHRDIHESNMLVNWYCGDDKLDHCSHLLEEHRRSQAAIYALFDYDLALQLPPETDLRNCRRPSEEAFTGKAMYQPADIYQGEWYYNPYAFDVACLGNMFLYHFIEAIPIAPLLAPLFGKMTTHIIGDRFTAAEALDFFRDIEAGSQSTLLDQGVVLEPNFEALEDPSSYWSRLRPEFQASWYSHRPPPLSWTIRLLRWLNTFRVGCTVITHVRRFFRI
ncbi:hypothetical protein BV20DRAFT_1031616 [Pilatotrama ljubarskyi]|nr:hypothetical protein BV20DRAFT_1031616 [Pilatotrama ljubarskyi]